MTYRCAFLGCGPRARAHAAAYAHIPRGEIVALCDVNEARLHEFGNTFSVPARYTDLDEMLRQEKPDLVHLVTPPTLRVPLMTRLAGAGVPGVIVEKPICIGADDYKALRALQVRSQTKFVVNHQLRHHPMILAFLQEVVAGQIGEVRFIDGSSLYPMAGQGVHVLDLIFAFSGYARPKRVFGAISGYDDIGGTHPGPRSAEFLIDFDNGIRAVLMSGAGAPTYDDGPSSTAAWMHKRVAVYGTHGFRHWRMGAWERSLPNGAVEQGRKSYREEDDQAQAALTEALFDWLADDAKLHPNNLATSLDEWQTILAGYASAIGAQPMELPFDPPDDLLDQLKRYVGAPAGQ